MLNSRVGVRWFPDEDEKLLQEINEKKTFEEIALEHKRTITGIKARVISQIIYSKYKNENKYIDDLSNEFKNIVIPASKVCSPSSKIISKSLLLIFDHISLIEFLFS